MNIGVSQSSRLAGHVLRSEPGRLPTGGCLPLQGGGLAGRRQWWSTGLKSTVSSS